MKSQRAGDAEPEPKPTTLLVRNLMSEIDRCKDYDKLTEQVGRLMHDNRELKSQLLTLMPSKG